MSHVTYRKVGFDNLKMQKSNYNPNQEGNNGNNNNKRNKVATEFVCKLLDRSLELNNNIIITATKTTTICKSSLLFITNRAKQNYFNKLHTNANRINQRKIQKLNKHLH